MGRQDRSARGLFVVGLFLAVGLILGGADDAWAQRGGGQCMGGSGGGSRGGMMGGGMSGSFAGGTMSPGMASPGMMINCTGGAPSDGGSVTSPGTMAQAQLAAQQQQMIVAYQQQLRAQQLAAAYQQQQQREARLTSVRNRREVELAQRAARRERVAETYARYQASRAPQFATSSEMTGHRR